MMRLYYIVVVAILEVLAVTVTGTSYGQFEKVPEYDVLTFKWFDSIESVKDIVESDVSFNGIVDTLVVNDPNKPTILVKITGVELHCLNMDEYNPWCVKNLLSEDESGNQYWGGSSISGYGATRFYFLNFGDSDTRLVGVERELSKPHSEFIFAAVGKRLAERYGKVSTAYPYSGKRDPKVVFGPIAGGVLAWTDRSSTRKGEIKYHQVWKTPRTKVEHIYGVLKFRPEKPRNPITRTHHVIEYESVERWTLWREAIDRFRNMEESKKIQEAEKRLENIDF